MQFVNGKQSGHLVNGESQPLGSIFGDAVFETMLVYQQRIHLLDLHLARLARGAAALNLECDNAKISEDLSRCLEQLDATQCFRLRLVLQRGQSAAGYSVENLATHRLLSAADAELPQQVQLCATRSPVVLSRQPYLAGLKHANRLEQVLARQKLSSAKFDEAIMLDENHHVIECIASNIYIMEDDSVISPPLNEAGVAGVAREWFKQRAVELGLQYSEQTMMLERLTHADAVFASNTILGFRQITTYADELDSWNWKPSPAIAAVQQRFVQSVTQ